MDKRKNRLLISIIIGILLSFLFAYFIPNIETGFNCRYCDFYTYRNDWFYDFDSKKPQLNSSNPFPNGYYTFEEIKQRFYFYLCMKILFFGAFSTLLTFYLLNKINKRGR